MRDGLFKNRMIGTDESPEYVVRDDRRHGLERFWTGRGWTTNLFKARRFFDPEVIAETIFRLTKRHFSRLYQRRRYNLRMSVTVYGPSEVTTEQVEEYLRKALTLRPDYVTHGIGPGEDTMVVVVPSFTLWEVVREK